MVETTQKDQRLVIKSDIERAVFLGNPHLDSMFLAMQSLAAEVWIGRRRGYILEALLAQKIAVTPEAIEQFVETPEQEKRWGEERERLIADMYAPFLRPGDLAFDSTRAQGFVPPDR